VSSIDYEFKFSTLVDLANGDEDVEVVVRANSWCYDNSVTIHSIQRTDTKDLLEDEDIKPSSLDKIMDLLVERGDG